jgi:exodeoxyribonuclease-1
MRDKRRVAELLDPARPQPLLHASARYPADYCGTALVAALLRDPVNPQGVVVYDLRHDPEPFLTLSVEALHVRLFTPAAELPAGMPRLPVKTVRINHCPVLAPLGTLDANAAARLDIDVQAAERHLSRLLDSPALMDRIGQALQMGERPAPEDVDQGLYQGGFFSNGDRRRMERVRQAEPEQLGRLHLGFEDPRLEELLFRYRVRNWPETLQPRERERWRALRERRIHRPDSGMSYARFLERLQELRADPGAGPAQRTLLDELEQYAGRLAADLEPTP